MSQNLTNQEKVQLAEITGVFNQVAEKTLAHDADAQLKLRKAMTPTVLAELQTAAMEIAGLAMNAAFSGKMTEEEEAVVAEKHVLMMDKAVGVGITAGLKDKFAACFPESEKTEATAENFRKLGAHNLAALCMK